MKNLDSFSKLLRKYKKNRNKQNVFLVSADPSEAVLSAFNEDMSLSTLLIYKNNDGNESFTGFIEDLPFNNELPISLLLDLEDFECPTIYLTEGQDVHELGQESDDLLITYCEFKKCSFLFYIFNTVDMQIGIKSFNHYKYSSTQYLKKSFLNALPHHKRKIVEPLLFPLEENNRADKNYNAE